MKSKLFINVLIVFFGGLFLLTESAMAELVFSNKAYSNIKGGITSTDTEIELYPGQVNSFYRNWESGKAMYLTITDKESEIETVLLSDIDGNTLTVSRGQDGTSAKEWPSGAVIAQRLNAASLESFIQREAYREVAYNPNGTLPGDYVGEKVYQPSPVVRWWKNISGTDWQMIAGAEIEIELYEGSGDLCSAICWSPELDLFVAVGMKSPLVGQIMTSPDGKNWTSRTSPGANGYWRSVCWSSNLSLFVAVGRVSGTYQVITSPDGINWTGRSTPGCDLHAVCWSSDLGLFCAVGQANNYVITSPDGINWTGRSASSGIWWTVCWSPDLSLFCAIAPDHTHPMTSPDGINWTVQSGGLTSLYGIAWSPTLDLFVAVGGESSGKLMTSPDGVNWTERSMLYAGWKGIAWSPDLGVFCAVGTSNDYGEFGTGLVAISYDGINWSFYYIEGFEDCSFSGVCWSPDLKCFCAISPTEGDCAALIKI